MVDKNAAKLGGIQAETRPKNTRQRSGKTALTPEESAEAFWRQIQKSYEARAEAKMKHSELQSPGILLEAF